MYGPRTPAALLPTVDPHREKRFGFRIERPPNFIVEIPRLGLRAPCPDSADVAKTQKLPNFLMAVDDEARHNAKPFKLYVRGPYLEIKDKICFPSGGKLQENAYSCKPPIALDHGVLAVRDLRSQHDQWLMSEKLPILNH